MDMNLYEMIDLNQGRMDMLLSMSEQNSTQFTIYLSLVTGYLITAFVAGKQLTRAQMLIASGVFVISTLFIASHMVIMSIISRNMLNLIVERAAETRAFQGLPASELPTVFTLVPFGIYGLLLLLILGLLAPLYFMWSVRHPKKE